MESISRFKKAGFRSTRYLLKIGKASSEKQKGKPKTKDDANSNSLRDMTR
jgi:hypothetical protein